ncbi:MAG: hypothetical protein C5B53_10170 [Candidatus Melainabacteria bacterium]|nr:MAG: hypothetical protein C5B53_10170 [Candidatus Melainabacteria bacterium]
MESIVDVVNRFLGQEVISLLEKATKATDVLKADHRKVEALFEQFTKASGADKQVLLESILKELRVHTTVEEELVYPILAQQDADLAAEAKEEHHIVKLLMEELASLSANSPLEEPKVKVLSEIVKAHVKEEEHTIFPALRKTGVDLDDLGMRIKDRRGELMMRSKATTIRQAKSANNSVKSKKMKGNGAVPKRARTNKEPGGAKRRAVRQDTRSKKRAQKRS